MKEEIPTAKQFTMSFTKEHGMDDTWLETLMVEFTKLHVKKALKIASEKAKLQTRNRMGYGHSQEEYKLVYKPSITKSYPLENIK
jgi:hypothetical protein